MSMTTDASALEKIIDLLSKFPIDPMFLLSLGTLIVAGLALYLAIIVVKTRSGG